VSAVPTWLSTPTGGAVLGLVAGLGLWLVLVRLPVMRRPTLDDRLAPYLRTVSPPRSRLLEPATTGTPFVVLERLLGPWMSDAVRWIERLSGGTASVRRRLDQLGGQRSVEEFRAEQVLWGVAGTGAGVLLGGLLAARGGVPLAPLAGLVLLGCLAGVLARDHVLTRQVQRREERMVAEFPTIAELLALSVSAGEGAIGALERVAGTCSGELSSELRRTLADARAGASLVQALEGLAARTSLPSLARFVDGVAVAVERGTPLADVLRAQAQDVRELGRRRLMETGGKKEIAMMVPVVFLVLPVVVIFAVYPGLAVLTVNL
jgi:tight adherence protein C